MRAAVALAIAVIAISIPGVAAGQPSDSDRARVLFEQAETHYRAGEYDLAIPLYEAAYAADPLPSFLFNIAQAHRLKGDSPAALTAYRRFVEVAPDHRLAEVARRHIAELEKEAAEQPDPVRPPPPSPDLSPGPSPRAQDDDQRRASRLRLAGWISGGVGIGLVALGVKFGVDMAGHDRALSDHTTGPWTDSLLDREGQGERAERNMYLSIAAGSAALVAGGVLLYLGRDREKDPRPAGISIAPGWSEHGGVLTVLGTF